MTDDDRTTDCDECGNELAKIDDALFRDGDDEMWLCDCCIEDRIDEQRERDGCPRCGSADRVVQGGKDSLTCEDCALTWVPEDLPRVTSLGFDFYRGDEVTVDWSEGQGPEVTVEGVVEDITVSAGDVVVSVLAPDHPEFPDGKTYDAAPEWIADAR